jgi:hypothetical protein
LSISIPENARVILGVSKTPFSRSNLMIQSKPKDARQQLFLAKRRSASQYFYLTTKSKVLNEYVLSLSRMVLVQQAKTNK